MLCTRGCNLHRCHRTIKTTKSCSACVRSPQESRNSLPSRWREPSSGAAMAGLPANNSRAQPIASNQPTQACEALSAVPVSIEQVRCRAAHAWCCSGLGKYFGSLFVLRLLPLLNAEQPLCLCHLSVSDAILRLTTIVVAGLDGYDRPI